MEIFEPRYSAMRQHSYGLNCKVHRISRAEIDAILEGKMGMFVAGGGAIPHRTFIVLEGVETDIDIKGGNEDDKSAGD